MSKKMRLQKFLAQCGIGSRRKCEEYIEQGRVKIDDTIIKEQGVIIDPDTHDITFDGKVVKPRKKIWILLHKPPMYICSTRDHKNRKTYLDLLPKTIDRVFCVGRLDYMSEGLLMLTNDGDTANKLIHPRYEITKKYEVTTYEPINDQQMGHMRQGIQSNNEILKINHIDQMKSKNKYPTYKILLTEGKTRHIRRMLSALDIHIVSLKRTHIGPIALGSLKKGSWRYATKEEINQIQQYVTSHH